MKVVYLEIQEEKCCLGVKTGQTSAPSPELRFPSLLLDVLFSLKREI